MGVVGAVAVVQSRYQTLNPCRANGNLPPWPSLNFHPQTNRHVGLKGSIQVWSEIVLHRGSPLVILDVCECTRHLWYFSVEPLRLAKLGDGSPCLVRHVESVDLDQGREGHLSTPLQADLRATSEVGNHFSHLMGDSIACS